MQNVLNFMANLMDGSSDSAGNLSHQEAAEMLGIPPTKQLAENK
jgi:hypothetical protein